MPSVLINPKTDDNRNAILKARQEEETKGRQEERLEIARSLLVDAEMIAQKTGLTIAQVQQLREF